MECLLLISPHSPEPNSFNPEPAATADLSPSNTSLILRSPKPCNSIGNLPAVAVGSGLNEFTTGSKPARRANDNALAPSQNSLQRITSPDGAAHGECLDLVS